MPTTAFIAYDFALIERGLSNVLEDAQDTQESSGLVIRYPGDKNSPRDHGSLWDTVVGGPIKAAEKFIAFIDLPNANVGFEIGYAFGCGKPVGIYRFSAIQHPWLNDPPLRGHIRHQLNSAEQIHKAINEDGLMKLSSPPPAGERVLFLCPSKNATAFRRQREESWGWVEAPLTEWTIDRLPEQFSNVGCVVWVITPNDAAETDRDGTENAVLSMIAGFAHAHKDIELHVFCSSVARFVADLGHISKKFASNAELKQLLANVESEWQAKLAASTQSSAFVGPPPPPATRSKPLLIPPHPHDPFPAHASQFIGREAQLNAGADAAEGIVERHENRPSLAHSHSVQLIWAHGFGGMGKSWCLQRIRCLAQKAHPQIRALIIDWDKPEWLAPLHGEPRVAEDVFDLVAIRLCQRVALDAADIYYEAKDRVRAAAEKHRITMARFENHLQLAMTGSGSSAESHLIQLLRADGLWDDEQVKRERLIRTLREDPRRHRDLFIAWCHETGEHDLAVICPRRELADGLRAALLSAMQQHPLIIVLDTCEILSDELHFWLRELLVPLIQQSAPLLLLIGSRLKPDLLQPRGSRRGWLAEVPRRAQRIEDFGEVLRFQVDEIEDALNQLKRPVPRDHGRLAELLHRITLGVPLALRGLLDLHEDGDDVFGDLQDQGAKHESLDQSEAVRQVISDLTARWLLNLEGHPERADDLRDITTLALLPVADHEVLKLYWHPIEPISRLRKLSQRYSLLSDGDLHPTVRACLRRSWRDRSKRHEHFGSVLSRLEYHTRTVYDKPSSRQQCSQALAASLNLCSWREDQKLIPDLARALCLARAFSIDSQLLETLLAELSLEVPKGNVPRSLWRCENGERPSDKDLLPWLQAQQSKEWTTEESAALALLEGIQFYDWEASESDARTAFAKLEQALTCFGLDDMPRSKDIGTAYLHLGECLHPYALHKAPDLVALSMQSFERAIALQSNAFNAHLGLATIYANFVKDPQKAEAHYLKTLELDPTFVSSHNYLGWLYHNEYGDMEKAENSFLKAIKLDSKSAAAHNGLAWLYHLSSQNPKKAKAFYLKAIELDPNFASPHTGLAWLYQDDFQQWEEAKASYLKAIEIDPKAAAAHNGLGSLYEEAQNWAEALAEYQQGVSLDSQNGSGHRGLAWIALLNGDTVDEARYWAKEAEKYDLQHPCTPLVLIAIEVWAGEWEAVTVRFAGWVSNMFSVSDAMIIWASRRRFAELLRKVSDAGKLEVLAVILKKHATLKCWEPWALAVDELLRKSPDGSGLTGRAAEVFQLIRAGEARDKRDAKGPTF